MYKKNQTSSNDQNAETPPLLMKQIMENFSLSWDPCPPNYSICGLKRTWKPGVYVNPPFRETKHWVKKAYNEGVYTVFLLPVPKLHRRFMEQHWRAVTSISLFPTLIKFVNYKKPLNKAMALITFYGNSPKPSTCHAFSWLGLKNRTMKGIIGVLSHWPVHVITKQSSKTIPPIFKHNQFIILSPSRLDLKIIRKNLHRFTEIIFCPTVKNHESDTDNMWLPPIILTAGYKIHDKLPGLSQHTVPVHILQDQTLK